MKKISSLIILSILLTYINACAGYKPIFSSSNLQFEIADYSIKGNKVLGNKIYSKLQKISQSKKSNQNVRSINLLIKSSTSKNATIKDSAGNILAYKITLMTEVKVTDYLDGDKILNQTFIHSVTYKVQDQYSDTIKLENRSINNLIDRTHGELLLSLSKNII